MSWHRKKARGPWAKPLLSLDAAFLHGQPWHRHGRKLRRKTLISHCCNNGLHKEEWVNYLLTPVGFKKNSLCPWIELVLSSYFQKKKKLTVFTLNVSPNSKLVYIAVRQGYVKQGREVVPFTLVFSLFCLDQRRQAEDSSVPLLWSSLSRLFLLSWLEGQSGHNGACCRVDYWLPV